MEKMKFTIGIITSSDSTSAGKRDDLSGPQIASCCEPYGGVVIESVILPDERQQLASAMRRMADVLKVDMIFTTGGTGFSPRDVTPEATLDVIERQVPGIPEAMRMKSMEFTQKAMLTRQMAGIRGKTLIINLPGSPKAVVQCLEVFLPVVDHALDVLRGNASNCAEK